MFNKPHNTKRKLHKTASSIGFIKKALYNKLAPRFAQINDPNLLIYKVELMQNES